MAVEMKLAAEYVIELDEDAGDAVPLHGIMLTIPEGTTVFVEKADDARRLSLSGVAEYVPTTQGVEVTGIAATSSVGDQARPPAPAPVAPAPPPIGDGDGGHHE